MSFTKVILLWLSISTVVMASSVPIGCAPIKIQGEALTIKTKKPSLIFMQNLSENNLWLTHPLADPGASAGWTSQLQSEHWSALVVTEASFVLHCTESRPGHEQQIPCEDALMACVWKKVKIPSQAKGTFWAAEDKSLAELKAAVLAAGFKLK